MHDGAVGCAGLDQPPRLVIGGPEFVIVANLERRHAVVSRRTFGRDRSRGPIAAPYSLASCLTRRAAAWHPCRMARFAPLWILVSLLLWGAPAVALAVPRVPTTPARHTFVRKAADERVTKAADER